MRINTKKPIGSIYRCLAQCAARHLAAIAFLALSGVAAKAQGVIITNLYTSTCQPVSGITLASNFDIKIALQPAAGYRSARVLSNFTRVIKTTLPPGANMSSVINWDIQGPGMFPWPSPISTGNEWELTGVPPVGSSAQGGRFALILTAFIVDPNCIVTHMSRVSEVIECDPNEFPANHIVPQGDGTFIVNFGVPNARTNLQCAIPYCLSVTVETDQPLTNNADICFSGNGQRFACHFSTPPQKNNHGYYPYDSGPISDINTLFKQVFWDDTKIELNPSYVQVGTNHTPISVVSATLHVQ